MHCGIVLWIMLDEQNGNANGNANNYDRAQVTLAIYTS